MDFTEINNYCATLYPIDGKTKNDAKQHMGNITIALDYVISSVERNPKGIDILPLLDRWANYYKVELGFGRYGYADYDSDTDCESKDIYRLLGRHVLPGRHVGPLNLNWKSLLEEQKFAAVRIHRQHPTEEPFIHILFKQEHKESWMTGEFSDPPANWLDDYGFDDMEHFEIKVGVIPEN